MTCKQTEQPTVNFFKCFTEEEPNQGLYRNLYEIGEENFNNWFYKNSIVCKVKTAKEIEPPKRILEELAKESNYNPAASQCHYNSQMACLLYDKLEFCTGFFINCESETFTHSFCLLNNRITDFTAKFFLKIDKFEFNINYFPLRYFGVKIERYFLYSKKQEIIESGYGTRPYLYEWYLETCKNC